MTRFNAQHATRQSVIASKALWLALLLASGCSLKSLEHLQSGEPHGGTTNGNQSGVEQGGSGVGGNLGQAGITESGATLAEGGGASTATGGTSVGSGGDTSTTAPQSVPSGIGGHGGAETLLSGGSPSSGGTQSGGAPGSTTVLNSGTLAGGAATGGSAGNAGSPTTSTAPSGMIYNVLGQSCARTNPCPGNVSCCTQIEIPGGSFTMGTNTDPARGSEESPPHPANVDGFAMDRFEVTVGRFRSFVEAYDGTTPPLDSGAHPKIAGSGWRTEYVANMPGSKAALKSSISCSIGSFQTWTESAGVSESMPMNCVNWYLAFAFCVWDGGRLPTEAEWEMAAANGSERRKYPWGESDANTTKHALVNCGNDKKCGLEDLLVVGSYADGANRWGHLDLAGNLWEWTLDYFDATFYQAIGTCDNCASLADTTPRVIRGGSFASLVNAFRATARTAKPPSDRTPYQGIRCVRSL